jgi:hypothetical protein
MVRYTQVIMLTSSDVSRWRRQMHGRARRCKAKQGRPGKTALTYETYLHNSTDFAAGTRGVKDLFRNTHLEVVSSVAHLCRASLFDNEFAMQTPSLNSQHIRRI